ncbi:hypothetical protein Vadar_006018 [Vaccinium darrowii]|uniref:Uncharacterized protein n=1 Tax=Vaccinium darrowii TaxID=229202 RepID=A0ACB7X7M6_9ERIC|nr:hypothetical protein Vadar_006018 [Vaccinium darrowii]
MAINQVKLAHENQMKPLKFQGSKGKANGISFWAYLLPICIFISIFYIFELSPSSLLNTTKFWFFLSNTLILIIAADFGASKKQAEIYDEYVEKTIGNISFPTFESRYPEKETVKTNNIPPPMVNNLEETQEKVKEVVVVVDEVRESESEENKEQVVVKDDVKESIEEPEEKMVEFPPNVDHEEAHEEEKEREKSIVNEPNEKQQEEGGKQQGGGGGGGGGEGGQEEEEEEEEEEEDDEFSKMSNEELNRRAEEFIQKFSRQIRLEAAQNKIQQVQRGNLVY